MRSEKKDVTANLILGAQLCTASSGVDKQVYKAWRTVKVFKTEKCAKALA